MVVMVFGGGAWSAYILSTRTENRGVESRQRTLKTIAIGQTTRQHSASASVLGNPCSHQCNGLECINVVNPPVDPRSAKTDVCSAAQSLCESGVHPANQQTYPANERNLE
eukprot:5072745-Pleurochrysis_carterae.AAC.4